MLRYVAPQQWAKVLPPQIVAVVAGTGAMVVLDQMIGLNTGIETIGSHFGVTAIPSGLPMPHIPEGVTIESMTRER